MTIRPKTPAEIQSSIAAFANEHPQPDDVVRRAIFERIADLATGPLVDYQDNVQVVDYANATVSDRPVHVKAGDYLDYMRRKGGRHNPAARERQEYLERYETEFAPQISARVAEYRAMLREERRLQPDYVNEGQQSFVFRFRNEQDGRMYVAKIDKEASRQAHAADLRMMQVRGGRNRQRYERFAGLSYTDRVAVMEQLPGVDLSHISPQAAGQITTDHIRGAFTLIREGHAAGLCLDLGSPNILFNTGADPDDPEAGFGLVDYESWSDGRSRQTLAGLFRSFREALVETGGYYADKTIWNAHRTRLIRAFRDVCVEQPDQENVRLAMADADVFLAAAERATLQPSK